MSEEALLLAAVLTNLLVAVFTAVAAFMAKRSTELTQTSLVTSRIEQRKLETIKHITNVGPTYRRLRSKIGPLPDDISEISSDMRADLMDLFGIWEHTAAGVNSGALDLEVINKTSGGFVLGFYRAYARFLRYRRRENSRIYDELDSLVDKLVIIQASMYEITRASLSRLRADCLDERALHAVEALIGHGPYTYSQLVDQLIRLDVDEHKSLIVSQTRTRRFEIIDFTDQYRQQVVQLFATVQKATTGVFPPAERAPNTTALERWIFDSPVVSRYLVRVGDNIVGHVAIAEPDYDDRVEEESQGRLPYWRRAFQECSESEISNYLIIKKMAVDPTWQGRGIGRILLRKCLREIQAVHHRCPALVVLKPLTSSIELYESEGGTRIGEFTGAGEGRLYTYTF